METVITDLVRRRHRRFHDYNDDNDDEDGNNQDDDQLVLNVRETCTKVLTFF